MLIVSFPGPHQPSFQCCNISWVGSGNEADNINELEYLFGKCNYYKMRCTIKFKPVKAITHEVNIHCVNYCNNRHTKSSANNITNRCTVHKNTSNVYSNVRYVRAYTIKQSNNTKCEH